MQDIPVLEAVSFRRWLDTGTTCPAVMECDIEGDRIEFVVKLRAATRMHTGSLVNELLASLIASALGLRVPDPAIVNISTELCNVASGIPRYDTLLQSRGLNFGTRFLKTQTSVEVNTHWMSVAERAAALEIFVFDALVQNIDRRTDKPNLLWFEKALYAIDHELAFSFVLSITNPEPWTFEALAFLKSHVYFNALHGKVPNFEDIRQRIGHFFESGTLIEAIALMPEEWMKDGSDAIDKIHAHFEKIEKHQNEFFDCLTLLLS